MKSQIATYKLIALLMLCLLTAGSLDLSAQKARQRRMGMPADTLKLAGDSLALSRDSLAADSLHWLDQERRIAEMEAPVDTARLVRGNDSIQRAMTLETKPKFVPNANRAIWYALVFPGGGQIYNRKYWKLPIVYGGFVGCAYALTWNNGMYQDYSQAYLDIMDDDDNTKSYEDFLANGLTITDSNRSYYQELFRKRKDFYRRYRDLSIFCCIGVYILSVIDAYVDAELSDFDISKDLGLKIQPAIFNDGSSRIPSAIGLQCYLTF